MRTALWLTGIMDEELPGAQSKEVAGTAKHVLLRAQPPEAVGFLAAWSAAGRGGDGGGGGGVFQGVEHTLRRREAGWVRNQLGASLERRRPQGTGRGD
ncbi:hypothetical protein H8959_008545 [Pygathrix nigripes]